MKRNVAKKILICLLAAVLALSAVSCGGNSGTDPEVTPTEAPVPETEKEKSPEERGETAVKELNVEEINAEGSKFEDRAMSDKLTENGKAAVEKAKEALSFMIFDEAKVTYDIMLKSQISYDNSARVADVIRRSLNGESVKIGILGDSIPSGAGASEASKALGGQIYDFWNDCFHPVGREGNAEYVNASIGSNSLLNVAHRMDEDLMDHKPDIVFFTEWCTHDAVNDKAAYESMLIRMLESGCAVVSVVVCADNGTNNTGLFRKTAMYYKVPMVSWAEAFKTAKLKWSDFGADSIHPNDRGHAGIAASTCLYLLTVAENLPEISSKEDAIPAEENNRSGRTFVTATIYDRNDTDKFTIESMGCFHDADMQLSAFRTYNGWEATGAGDPIIFTVKDTASFMMLLGHRTSTGKCTVRVENAETGKKLSEETVECASTYDYSWNTGTVKNLEGTTLRVTVTPIGGTMILGLMVTPVK